MRTNYHIITLLLSALLFYNCDSTPEFELLEGDFLFQDVDCGPFCEAIEAVTEGVDHYNFSHVGLVMKNEAGELQVMEAVSEGVILTPLKSFLKRSLNKDHNPKVAVGRLKHEFNHLTPDAITFIKSKMDAKYDAVFDFENDSYYCSELIYFAYKAANNGTSIFEVAPMTYIAPDTNETFAIWDTYFYNLNTPVPEGKPGINPGGMSQSPYLDIVHLYGQPSKREP
ncbi:conserved hypothetical protein (DUF830) [Formosa agariphila KMM 3901]|uniref:Permuted papain-like amidase YaeF/Yiix C92 family enzyme n=1 Tax=Formosa agariphila (strain DSM 15362 / KCTC 12365 / LMG 23005 / KMM 3901 / M-2Alg 35-1) TaxID=1347342 RepID=T2KIX0_FORAG|nr:YiiX/YebB-like N1pC/P60 family cysteine hydrolase [Formosa agariphila]CDF78383.1 conserved hypothetical protein (DUF830) [Formosa agariphila KMM 3901]